jgi:hypothetical protein
MHTLAIAALPTNPARASVKSISVTTAFSTAPPSAVYAMHDIYMRRIL